MEELTDSEKQYIINAINAYVKQIGLAVAAEGLQVIKKITTQPLLDNENKED